MVIFIYESNYKIQKFKIGAFYGFLNNTTVTVDAVLTKKGREVISTRNKRI